MAGMTCVQEHQERHVLWQVVAETEDLIAVHKPPSVPVHVSGQYRKNTVMALLQVERPDLGRLFPVHRLDKPVSGLLLIAKNAAAANVVRALITVSMPKPLLHVKHCGCVSSTSSAMCMTTAKQSISM